jgi:hypothetical protein
MTAKRASPRNPSAKTKVKRPAKALTDNAALVILESTAPVSSLTAPVDPETRRQMVAAEAYFRAERRGFAAGHELEDWVAAEAAVDSRLNQMQAA